MDISLFSITALGCYKGNTEKQKHKWSMGVFISARALKPLLMVCGLSHRSSRLSAPHVFTMHKHLTAITLSDAIGNQNPVSPLNL